MSSLDSGGRLRPLVRSASGLIALAALAYLTYGQPGIVRSVDPPLPGAATDLLQDPPSEATDLPPGVSADWWQTVRRDIRAREYHASVGDMGLQAPNRAHSFRTYFRTQGIEIVPHHQNWSWGWETVSWGRDGWSQPVERTPPMHDAARVEYVRDLFVEWYRNGVEGVEQGFTLATPPPGDGLLWIEGSITGSLAAQAANEKIDFLTDSGQPVLTYDHLVVTDAEGRELDAFLALADDAIRIRVDDRDAAYPIVIDPLMSTPDWLGHVEQGYCGYGQSVATAGDVNGDGYSDVIVAAPIYNVDQNNEGRVYCYLGSASGLDTSPDWWTDGNQSACTYGVSISTAGDVNGDGYDDIIIGADGWDGPDSNEGRVCVFHGSPDGLEWDAAWIKESGQAQAYYGISVCTAGDVNGDGYDDVIVGADRYDHGQLNEGMAWVYHGSASGLISAPAWDGESNQEGAGYGQCVATAGDVNGDGYADIIVGADTYDGPLVAEGRAYVYHGSSSGLSDAADWVTESNVQYANYGYTVAPAGDVNGDGYSDVLVAAPWCDGSSASIEGRAYLFQGSDSGLSTSPSWITEGGQNNCRYGFSLGTAGDLNGDGYSDVIVSAKEYTDDLEDQGRVYVYMGYWTGLSTEPVWTMDGDQEGVVFGYCVATAGDVNGDGFSEVIIGSPSYDWDNDGHAEGQAFMYQGSADGPQTSPGWVTESNQANAHYGRSVAHLGDVNGDGYGDVVVGVPDYDNGQENEGAVFLFLGSHLGLSAVPVWYAESNQADARLGGSVAWAGDVNGDGYPDAIIGAHGYEENHAGEGAAFIWLSRPGGAPYGNPANADWAAYGGQQDAMFGYSVASAGDVNADGYADVVVGAPYYDAGQTDEGAAFAYFGSATGPSTTQDWFHGADYPSALYGISVASAGDFNGDGYSDVAVGATGYDHPEQGEGAAFIYIGSEDGPQTGAPWWWAQSDQENAYLGFCVSSAGDVNGDGFSDVIFGAPGYDFTATDGGGAFLFHGAAERPPTGTPYTAEWGTSFHQSSSYWGWAVSSGDLDSDGYSDVIIGGPNAGDVDEGLVAAWFGSEDGIVGGAARWLVWGNRTGADFGSALTGAGDVNGDGFCDVIVGAGYYTAGQTYEGRAFLYYGNDSRGLARIPRQYQSDFSDPIALLGESDSETEFGLRALGRTAAGRGLVRLEYEIRPHGVPFDGTDVESTGWLDTGAPDGAAGSRVVIEELVSGLTEGLAYRWRARVVSTNPLFPTSPWITMPGNGGGEMDFRTTGVLVAVADPTPAAARLRLGPAAPNPFNPRTTIGYVLAQGAPVRLTLHDVNGRLIRTLVEQTQDAGEHSAVWDGRNDGGQPLASGVYFIRLQSGGEIATRQVVLMK